METEKKLEAKKSLERIQSQTFSNFESAAAVQSKIVLGEPIAEGGRNVVKKKIFARHNGTFDLVLYATPQAKVETPKLETKPEEPKVHGLKAKDRRRQEKSTRRKESADAAARHRGEQ